MSEMRKVWKLLLKKEFYDKHKSSLPINSFDEIGQLLLPTLKRAHETLNRDINANDLLLLYVADNPVLTTSRRSTLEIYLNNLNDEENIELDTADIIYSALWKKEVGRRIAEFGIKFSENEYDSLSSLNDYLNSINDNWMPNDFGEPVETEPLKLIEKLNRRNKWVLNIPTLSEKVQGVSPGHFIVLIARPESGKTAALVNMISGKEGFAAQGAKVCYLANEEVADVTAGRAICCYNEMSYKTILSNPQAAKTEGWESIRHNLSFLHKPEITFDELEAYLKDKRPDILVIDQLDHLVIPGSNGSKDYETLGKLYRKARELAVKYLCVVIAVSQASIDAEDKSEVTFSMAAGSKTDKAAAADLFIGIGRVKDKEDGNQVLRYFTVSKNKISGWRGTVIAKLIQDQSRFIP